MHATCTFPLCAPLPLCPSTLLPLLGLPSPPPTVQLSLFANCPKTGFHFLTLLFFFPLLHCILLLLIPSSELPTSAHNGYVSFLSLSWRALAFPSPHMAIDWADVLSFATV